MWKLCTLLLFCFYLGDMSCYSKEIQEILPQFEAFAQKSLKEWNAVGMAVAIVKDGKAIYSKGFGQRGLKDKRPIDAETLFQIGSISKSFTTALTAIAVDRKLIQWEDSVLSHFPDFMLYDSWVTRQFEIEDLYAQRSGLSAEAGDAQAALNFPIDRIIHNLRYFQPITSFRSQYAYQNSLFSVGAKILEQVQNASWKDLIQKELFQPLGMNRSSATLEDYLQASNRVDWHVRQVDGTILQIPFDTTSAQGFYIYEAAGGINSTLKDMIQWVILQSNEGVFQGKKLITPENLSRTWRPHVYVGKVFDHQDFYGLGWVYTEFSPYPIIWHNGQPSGSRNIVAFVPQDKVGIVVLCNTAQALVAEALAFHFFDLYYDQKPKDWNKLFLAEVNKPASKAKETHTSSPLPALPLEQYSGIYTNEVYGEATVSIHEGHLQIKIGPEESIWPLKHVNKDTFNYTYAPDGVDSPVYFFFHSEDKPAQMQIAILQADGQGTFVRKVND